MKPKSTIVGWTSRKASAKNANREFTAQVKRMEARGYEVISVNIVPAGRSKRSWLLLGILNFIRGKQVQVIATFRLTDAEV